MLFVTKWFRGYYRSLHGKWPAGLVERFPLIRVDGSTTVHGIRIAGDLTGIPLLKFAVNSGVEAVRSILKEPDFRPGQGVKEGLPDLVIIGAGVSGISAAIEAKRAGLSFVIFEAKRPFSTLWDFPKGKPIHTFPSDMIPAGDFVVSADVKESLLDEMETQRKRHGIEIAVGRVDHIESKDKRIVIHHGDKSITTAFRAVVAIGRSGNYRKLDCPGEDLGKVHNRLHDPKEYAGQKVMVVGGGDSALESAIALAESGAEVVISYRNKEFFRPKPENIEKFTALADGASNGLILPAMGTTVKEILRDRVVLVDKEHQEQSHPNDVVFAMIGREAPLDFFRRSGIAVRGEGKIGGWIALAGFLMFCVFVFTWKSGGFSESWLDPWPWNMLHLTAGLGKWFADQISDRSTLVGTLAVSFQSRSFYYTLLYSLCVIVFGLRRIRRRKTPYVTIQTMTLMAIQVLPLFLLPELILPYLGYNGLFTDGIGRSIGDNLFEMHIPISEYAAGAWPDWGHPRAYWRAYGFILAWPLMVYNIFTGSPMWWWVIIGSFQTCVMIPWLIYYYGKGAYCGWICSCGALAETMGDTERSKMPHGPLWNRLNMTGQAILWIAFLFLIIRIIGWALPGSWADRSFSLILEGKDVQGRIVNPFSYKWVVDTFLAGILGVGLYFKYSGRVWCRFACPLAALMHIYARFSRFRIFSDKKKCISCNACTGNCHQGIDIMGFANKGMPMEDPECVRCSACVEVCPTGVLTFGRYASTGDVIYDKLDASPVQMKEKEHFAEN